MSSSAGAVVVVGGGVMGLSCAWRMAQAGARVTLLEVRDCGGGATLAALGALWPASPQVDGPLQRLHRESLWEFESFTRELAGATGVPIRYLRLGRVEILESDKDAQRAREEALAGCAKWPPLPGEAAPVRAYLEPSQVHGIQPGLCDAPHGALLCRATAQVDVSDLVAALRAACAAAGVVIRVQTHVDGLMHDAGRVVGVETGAGPVPADVLLVAAGAWSSLLPEVKAAVTVRPVKGQGLALRIPAGTTAPRMIVKRGKVYLIPWHDRGEILVGSTTEKDAGFDETPTAAARETLLAGAAAIMPALSGAEVLRHWAGLRPQNAAKRHWPVMGRVAGVGNVYVCVGHFKTGVGMAPAVSRLMSESVLSGKISERLAPFAPNAIPVDARPRGN